MRACDSNNAELVRAHAEMAAAYAWAISGTSRRVVGRCIHPSIMLIT